MDPLDAVRARIAALEAEVERLSIENESLHRARARLEARANRWEDRVVNLGKRYVAEVARATAGHDADAAFLASVERHLALTDTAAFRAEIAKFAAALAAADEAFDARNHDELWTALDLAARD